MNLYMRMAGARATDPQRVVRIVALGTQWQRAAALAAAWREHMRGVVELPKIRELLEAVRRDVAALIAERDTARGRVEGGAR